MRTAKRATELLAEIDELHPLERERVCECLTLHDARTYDLLCEVEARYGHAFEADQIVALCKRVLQVEADRYGALATSPVPPSMATAP